MSLSRIILVLAGLAALGAGPCPPRIGADPPSPAVEIDYIPQEDLSRAPGYSKSGVFLPLSDLLELAEEAQRRHALPPQERPAYCTSLSLRGALGEDDALRLEGEMAFEAPEKGWTAGLVDDGAMPWTSQQTTTGTLAFLARLNSRTFLFAKGPVKGVVSLKATLPAPFSGSRAALKLGRFFAPCRIEADLPPSVELLSTTAPTKSDIGAQGSSWRLSVWPTQGQPAEIRLLRKAPLRAPSCLRVKLDRNVEAVGAGLEVRDDLILEDRFTPASPLRIPLPKGLRLLRTGTTDPVQIAATDQEAVLTPRRETKALHVGFVFAAMLRDGRAALGGWVFPAAAQQSVLKLHASDRYVPLPMEMPASLFASGGTRAHAQYEIWGPLPDLQIALAPAAAGLAPRVKAGLKVKRGEAAADYVIDILDTHETELIFTTPQGWLLTELEAVREGSASPCSIQEKEGSTWRVAWDPQGRPQSVRFSVRRVGAWGAPGTTRELDLPLVRFDGPRPTDYEMRVSWPEEIEAAPAKLSALQLIPVSEHGLSQGGASQGVPSQAAQVVNPPTPAANLALQAVGEDPKGTLAVSGRNSELRATAVTALSIGEDRAKVRALIDYLVRLAPANTFRFVLPAGVGPDVRIEGNGIRESTLRSTGQGDEWTVVTQNGVLGSFRVTLEWPLDSAPGAQPVAAPQIRIPDVVSQQGFVVLEGSETLRLTAETRDLAEADLAEAPPLPWPRENRVLAVYRYVEPPFLLRVKAEKFHPEAGLEGLVRDAKLTTTVSPAGDRLTLAEYSAAPMADRQFFEVRLPQGAEVWSALVNGQGVKPALRTAGDGTQWLLAPLPAASAGAADFRIAVLYREQAAPLAGERRLELAGPSLSVPVNRTVWDFNLPRGFEYLSFGGAMLNKTLSVEQPVLTFLRTAHYPDKILFLQTPNTAIAIVCAVAVGLVWVMRLVRRRGRRELPERGRKAEEPRVRASSVIAWLVLLGFVLVMAAIAVPNFLEAQIRSKVSRAKADQRSIATALESYYVDNNVYPTDLRVLWQGAVKYMGQGPMDPYAEGSGDRSLERYIAGVDAFDRAARAGFSLPPEARNPSFWMIYSLGPDMGDNGGRVVYDPTNGTNSVGDVIRLKDDYTSFRPRYAEVRGKEELARGAVARDQSAVRQLADGKSAVTTFGYVAGRPPAPTPSPSAPAMSPTFEAVPEILALPPVSPAASPISAAGAAISGPIHTWQEFNGLAAPAEGKPVENIPARTLPIQRTVSRAQINQAGEKPVENVPAQPPRVEAGLLSLSIEVPQGGMQRSFESLGPKAQIDIHMLETSLFKRVRFLVMVGSFLVLAIVCLLSRRAYHVLFVLALAATLIVPATVQTPWTAFFNAAFKGALFSLIVWLLSFLWKRTAPRPTGAAGVALLLAALSASSSTAHARKASPEPPIRIVVPYGENPEVSGGGLAFISREDFARLWGAAQPGGKPVRTLPAILADLRLDGSFSSEESAVRGVIRILAANPNDGPTSVSLGLAGLALSSLTPAAPGAALESRPGGLVLRLDAHWAGAVEASFALPCKTDGATGRLRLEFPAAAAGEWRIRLPYKNAEAKGAGGAPHLRELLADSTVVFGPVRPGPLDVNWAPEQAGVAGTAQGKGPWRASIQTTVVWNSLAAAEWRSEIRLEAEGGGWLPDEARFTIDPALRISAAAGEQLRGAVVSGSEIVLQLRKSAAAAIHVEGVLPPPGAAANEKESPAAQIWKIAGLQAPQGAESTTKVRLEISDRIQILSIEPKGLDARPALEGAKGRAIQSYEATAPNWGVELDLRRQEAAFKAELTELLAPEEGLLRQAASLVISPRGTPVRQILIETSPGLRARSIEGEGVSGWTQGEGMIVVSFDPPIEKPVGVQLRAESDRPLDSTELTVAPLRLRGAEEVRRLLSIAVPPDQDLVENDLAGATPRAPGPDDKLLASMALKDSDNPPAALRAYSLPSEKPIRFGLSPIEPLSRDTAFNRVIIAEGRQSLVGVLRAEPRRGRLRQVTALLSLAQPDPGAASRLQAFGPVRGTRTEPVTDRVLRVIAELDAPQAAPVEVRFQFDQRADTAGDKPFGPALLFPEDRSGARAFLLLRRTFEGELSVAEAGGAQPADPARIPWPSDLFRPGPSDQSFELSVASRASPAFRITRHARDEALRAIVEVMRQRTILTADGFERNELEIVVQNQSEQFLKIAFPYPKSQVSVYEVQVAGRRVKTVFSSEKGRDVLLVPLIRTGLLEPELSVRIAYTAQGREPLKTRGKREQQLPEILGGVPIAQSALVLMLPPDFQYFDFQGALKQAELVDLEVDETLRESKRLEKVSEAVMFEAGAFQAQALSSLKRRQAAAEVKLGIAKKTVDAYGRNVGVAPQEAQEQERAKKLGEERGVNLQDAEKAQKALISNIAQLDQLVQQQIQPQPAQMPAQQLAPVPSPSPPEPAVAAAAAAPIAFPRTGDVLVFRQLQGAGSMTFRYASRDLAGKRNDLLLGLGAIVLVAAAPFVRRLLFASRRRAAFVLLALCFVLILLRVTVDAAIIGAALALVLLMTAKRNKTRQLTGR